VECTHQRPKKTIQLRATADSEAVIVLIQLLSYFSMFVFQLRKAFRNILRTLPDVVHILALFLASIAIFALLALKLMQNRSGFSTSLCSDVADTRRCLLSVIASHLVHSR